MMLDAGCWKASTISEDVAQELRRRCDLQLQEVPSNIREQ